MKYQIKFCNPCRYHRSSNHHFLQCLHMILLLLIGIIELLPFHSFTQPLAQGNDRFVGNIISYGYAIRSDFSNYWNQVTAEDAGKWPVAGIFTE